MTPGRDIPRFGAFKNGFRVIASTETVDAKDNAGLTGTGVKIYWMGSNNRVADDYADRARRLVGQREPTDKNGSASSAPNFWTGSGDDGTEGDCFRRATVQSALGTDANFGGPARSSAAADVSSQWRLNPLRAGISQPKRFSSPLYALSQELKLPPLATRSTQPVPKA